MNKYARSIFALFTLLAVSAEGSVIQLDMSLLPSSQGWLYLGSKPENQTVDLTNRVITFSSLQNISDYWGYYYPLAAYDQYVFEAEMRVLNANGDRGSFEIMPRYNVGSPQEGRIQFGPGSAITVSGGIPVPHSFILSEYFVLRLVGSHSTQTYDLYINGTHLGNYAIVGVPFISDNGLNLNNFIAILDGTTAAGNTTQVMGLCFATDGDDCSVRHPITSTAIPPGAGTVSCTPNPVSHGNNSICTANPNDGYILTAWSGDCSGATCELNGITVEKSVSANFSEIRGIPLVAPWGLLIILCLLATLGNVQMLGVTGCYRKSGRVP